MDVEITKLNGESFRLSEHDVTVRDFVVGSPTINPVYSQIEGRHGRVDMGAVSAEQGKKITIKNYMRG